MPTRFTKFLIRRGEVGSPSRLLAFRQPHRRVPKLRGSTDRGGVMGWYEIRVQGRLAERWAGRFEGMSLVPGPSGVTVLAGPVEDQAALHGLLRALGDLGLPLLSVTEVHPDRTPTTDQVVDTSRTGD
jgi:hypothetical protein